MEHVHGVLPVLHAQAEAEFGVGPDVVVHGSAGLLGRQDQVHAKGASHLGDADQLLHELGLLALEFRELVDNDKEVRHRHRGLVALVQPRIEVDVVDAVFRENALPAHVFALDADHGAADLVAGQVGDLAGQVREAGEQVRHAAALEVDDEKADILRAEIDRQGENVGLQGLGFAGACGARHEAVGPVEFFMDIQIAVRAAGLFADQRLHAVVVSVLAPAVQDIEFLKRVDAVHLKKADAGRDLAVGLDLPHPDVGQAPAEILQLAAADRVGREAAALFLLHVHQVIDAGEKLVVFDHGLAGIGELLHGLHHQEGRQAVQRLHVIDVFRQDLSLQDGGVGDENDVMGLCGGVFLCPGPGAVLHAGPEDV